jgi:hypothetical protein
MREFSVDEDEFWLDDDEDNWTPDGVLDTGFSLEGDNLSMGVEDDDYATDPEDEQDFTWTDATSYLGARGGHEVILEARREEDVRDSIEVCVSILQTQGDRTVDELVGEMRKLCEEIEVRETRRDTLQTKFNRVNLEYSLRAPPRAFPAFHVTRGRELAHMFDAFTGPAPLPTDYPLESHMVVYTGESGIDGGGLRREFFGEVCSQLRDLFDYIDLETTDPRMYISQVPDEEIVSRLNRRGGKIDGTPFNVSDLPLLYKLAGGMCQHAAVGRYSTGIPISRALLTAMVSADTGVGELQLATIYLIEAYRMGRDEVRNTKLVADSIEEDFAGVLVERAREVYLLADPLKKNYVADFVSGFRIGDLLARYKISPGELHEVIGGRIFSKADYESFWREQVIFVGDEAVKRKFLDLHLGHDEELVSHLRLSDPRLRDMSDDEVLEIYHKNTLWSIASTPIPSRSLTISVYAGTNVEGLFAHSCSKTLDVNGPWILSASFSGGEVSWISQAEFQFMSRGYTRQ